jgi:hypothetical protein
MKSGYSNDVQEVLAWRGEATLQQAPSVLGPWNAATSAIGVVTATGAPEFFRLEH